MPNSMEITVEGDRELIAKFTGLQNLIGNPKLNQALLDVSMVVERKAKENLNEMVYSQPESEGYQRTHGLFDKTLASGKVEREGSDTLVTTVKSEVHYAKYVHFGTGRGRNSFPRPFLTKALQDSKEDAEKIIGSI